VESEILQKARSLSENSLIPSKNWANILKHTHAYILSQLKHDDRKT